MLQISPKHQKALSELLQNQKEQQAFVDQTLDNAIETLKSMRSDSIELYVDGGSRGNPGIAGGGFAIYKGGKLIEKGSEFFGTKTNNQAEYLALRLALREAYDRYGDHKIKCFMDSQLAVEQMNGNYKVKSPNVKPLFEEVEQIAQQFKDFHIFHVPRSQNKVADKLANEAMDRRASHF
jgi:ribonuclease HI